MKRFGPPLLPIVLAFTILAAPHMEFPAWGQTEKSGKATPSEAEMDTKVSSKATPSEAETDETASLFNTSLEVTSLIAAGAKEVIATELELAADTISHLLTLDSYRNYAFAVVKLSDKTRAFYPIRYELDLLDQAEPGFMLIPGFIEIPEDVSLPPEFDREVLLPVFLYDSASPCEIPVVSFTLSPDYILLREIDEEETLLQSKLLNQSVWFYFEGGYSWSTDMDWDISGVRFGIPGNYMAHAVAPSVEGITLPAGFSNISAAVIIQDGNKFMLGPPEFRSAHMDVCWTKETPDLSLLRGYYAIGDGDWQEDAGGDLINLEKDYMYVYYSDVKDFDTPYYFKLSYDGEDSNILKVYMSEDKMYYNFYDGDRDGGDREEQNTPSVGQPSPPNPSADGSSDGDISGPSSGSGGHSSAGSRQSSRQSSSSSQRPSGPSGSIADGPAAVSETEAGSPVSEPDSKLAERTPVPVSMEEDTDDYVALSGNRIKKYLEFNPGQPLIVAKHRIRLSIPTDTGLFSGMDGQSLFRAKLLVLSEKVFSVELLIDGIPLKDIPPLTITIPCKPDEEDLIFSLIGTDGEILDETRKQGGFLTFTVTQTGTFTLESIPLPTDSLDGKAVSAEAAGNGSSGNFAVSDGSVDSDSFSRSDASATTPTAQTSAAKSPWGPILFPVSALTLSGLYFRRHVKRRHGKKGGETP